MSGGSYGYAYLKVEEFLGSLRNVHNDPIRAAFQEHLVKIAKAMQAIEWVDSCDYGKGDEHAFILACIQVNDLVGPSVEQLTNAIGFAERTLELLKEKQAKSSEK